MEPDIDRMGVSFIWDFILILASKAESAATYTRIIWKYIFNCVAGATISLCLDRGVIVYAIFVSPVKAPRVLVYALATDIVFYLFT